MSAPLVIVPRPELNGVHEFDDRDALMVLWALAVRSMRERIEVGDWVVFADGVERRVSYCWIDGDDPETAWQGVQTSDGGSWHLSEKEGFGSFSGALYTSVPLTSISATDLTKLARWWVFHHDWWGAGRGVHFDGPVRVWECSLPAPKV